MFFFYKITEDPKKVFIKIIPARVGSEELVPHAGENLGADHPQPGLQGVVNLKGMIIKDLRVPRGIFY